MKLSEGVEAAIHCCTLLASLPEGSVMAGSDLAEVHGLSQSYLFKHLKALTGAGVLTSVPGPRGGYRLAYPPEEISLLDVVLAIEGPEPAFRCQEIRRRGPGAPDASAYPAPCAINAAMLRAEARWREALRETRLSDLNAAHEASADPRVLKYGCAVIAARHRPQD